MYGSGISAIWREGGRINPKSNIAAESSMSASILCRRRPSSRRAALTRQLMGRRQIGARRRGHRSSTAIAARIVGVSPDPAILAGKVIW